MEHGSFTNNSHASFTLAEEDHTLANAVRFMLNQELVSSSFSQKSLLNLLLYIYDSILEQKKSLCFIISLHSAF